MSLMIRMSIADILLVEKLVRDYMKENNVTIDHIDEKVIQARYDEIMNKKMWQNPADF